MRDLDFDWDEEKHSQHELEKEEKENDQRAQLYAQNHSQATVCLCDFADIGQDGVIGLAVCSVEPKSHKVNHLPRQVCHHYLEGIIKLAVDKKTRPLEKPFQIDLVEETLIIVASNSIHHPSVVVQVRQGDVPRAVDVDSPGNLVDEEHHPEQNAPSKYPLGDLVLVHLVLLRRPTVERQKTDARICVTAQNGNFKYKKDPDPCVREHSPRPRVVECLYVEDVERGHLEAVGVFLGVEHHGMQIRSRVSKILMASGSLIRVLVGLAAGEQR